MNLQSAIAHMKEHAVEQPPEKIVEYRRLLSWLNELAWYRIGCPVPTELHLMKGELERDFKGANVSFSRPIYDDRYWIDMDYGELSVSIIYMRRKHAPWGLCRLSDQMVQQGFCETPDEEFETAGQLIDAVKKLIYGHE